jgi:hypothetical protein
MALISDVNSHSLHQLQRTNLLMHPTSELAWFSRTQGGVMKAETEVQNGFSLRKLITFATIASGVIAAYMMYRRGASLPSIAKQTLLNPVGSLVSEVKNVG